VISRRPIARAEYLFERVHVDFVHMTDAYNDNRYCAHFLDDRTRMNYVYNCTSKDEFLRLVIKFANWVKR
jgi:hypothetical protein